MSDDKTYATEARLNSLIANGLDTWHAISAFLNGWAVGTNGYCKYKLDVTASLCLAFSLQSPGTLTDNTQIFTLPGGYYPLTIFKRVPVYSAVTGAESAAIHISTAGAVLVEGIGGTATTRIDYAGVIPLD